MTTTVKLDLKGMEEYLERIAEAGRNIEAAAARAVMAGAEVIQDGMQVRVAVLTGNLKDNIDIKGPVQDGFYIYAEVGLIPGQTDADTMRYGMAQEYGTPKMPKHSFIRTTQDADAAKARAAMRNSLKKDGVL